MSLAISNPIDTLAARQAAGTEAFNRAVDSGYTRHTALALRRLAYSEWRDDETPEQTAERVVATPEASATKR